MSSVSPCDVDRDTAVRLRNEATAMLGTGTKILDMVKRLDPNFAASHSEVHIEKQPSLDLGRLRPMRRYM
jgi:hypothetical protein